MGRVRNAKIGGGGFTGKTFGISGIEKDKSGATTTRAAAKPRSGRVSGRSIVKKGGSTRAKMPHHHSSVY